MAQVSGRLLLDRFPDGNVQMVFMLNRGSGKSRQLLAKDTGQAESDLITTFRLSPSVAHAQISELEKTGHADMAVSIEEELAAELVQSS